MACEEQEQRCASEKSLALQGREGLSTEEGNYGRDPPGHSCASNIAKAVEQTIPSEDETEGLTAVKNERFCESKIEKTNNDFDNCFDGAQDNPGKKQSVQASKTTEVEVDVLVDDRIIPDGIKAIDLEILEVPSSQLGPTPTYELKSEGKINSFHRFKCSFHLEPGVPLNYRYRISPSPIDNVEMRLTRRIRRPKLLESTFFDHILASAFVCQKVSRGQEVDESDVMEDAPRGSKLSEPAPVQLHSATVLKVRLQICLEALTRRRSLMESLQDSVDTFEGKAHSNNVLTSSGSDTDLSGPVQQLLHAMDFLTQIKCVDRNDLVRLFDFADVRRSVVQCAQNLVSHTTESQKKRGEDSTSSEEDDLVDIPRACGKNDTASLRQDLLLVVLLAAFGHVSVGVFSRSVFLQATRGHASWWQLKKSFNSSLQRKIEMGITSQVRLAMLQGESAWMTLSEALGIQQRGWRSVMERFARCVTPADFDRGVTAAADSVSAGTLAWLLTCAPTVASVLSLGRKRPLNLCKLADGVLRAWQRENFSLTPEASVHLQDWLRACEPDTAEEDCSRSFGDLLKEIHDVEAMPLVMYILRVLIGFYRRFGNSGPLACAAKDCAELVPRWSRQDAAQHKDLDTVLERLRHIWKPLLATVTTIVDATAEQLWQDLGEVLGGWLRQSVQYHAVKLVEVCLNLLGKSNSKDQALPSMMSAVVERELVQAVSSAKHTQQQGILQRLLDFGSDCKTKATKDAATALLLQAETTSMTTEVELVRSLLTWPLWKHFLKSPLADSLSWRGSKELARMRAMRDRVAEAVKNQSVTVEIALLLQSDSEAVSELFGDLCAASLRSASAAIADWRTRRKLVRSVVNLCGLMQPGALERLRDECAADADKMQVCQLSSMLPLSSDIRGHLEHFQRTIALQLFKRLWCVACTSSASLRSLNDTVSARLVPFFRHLREVVAGLEAGTASIGRVMALFRDVEPGTVPREVQQLAAAASEEVAIVPPWCERCAAMIKTASIITGGQRACSAMVNITKCLDLDLSSYDPYLRLEQWHHQAATLTEKPLKSLAETDSRGVEVLRQMSDGQAECLEAVSSSKPLASWLHKGGSLAEFGRRVRILAGSVEAPQDVARISAIDTIHTRLFGLLELTASRGRSSTVFKKLIKAICSLDDSGDLASKIVQCSNDLSWFQKLESEAEQGAFVDSKNKMDLVMTAGTLQLHGTKHGAVVQVMLPPACGIGPLSLQDVADLRARVSLLVSPEDDKNAATLHNLGRLVTAAEHCRAALQGLLDNGSVCHQEMVKECSSVEEVEELREAMQDKLEAWNAFVAEQRGRHRILNHFTMKQLGLLAGSPLFEFEETIDLVDDELEAMSDDCDDVVAEEDVQRLIDLTASRVNRTVAKQALVRNGHSVSRSFDELQGCAGPSSLSSSSADDVVELLRVVNEGVSRSSVQARRVRITQSSRTDWLAGDRWMAGVEALLRGFENNRYCGHCELSALPEHAVSLVVLPDDRVMVNALAAVSLKYVSPRNVMLCSAEVSQEQVLLFVRRALSPQLRVEENPLLAAGAAGHVMVQDAEDEDVKLIVDKEDDCGTFFLLAGAHRLSPSVQNRICDAIHETASMSGASKLVVTCGAGSRLACLCSHSKCAEDACTPWSEEDVGGRAPTSNVTVFSGPAQSGKSLQIRRSVPRKVPIVTVVVHTSCLSTLCESLRDAINVKIAPGSDCAIVYHIEVSPTFSGDIDAVAFALTVAGFVQSASGHVWHRRAQDVLFLELPENGNDDASLSSVVLQQQRRRPTAKNPHELLEHLEALESAGCEVTELHRTAIGADEDGGVHLDPDVWRSQGFQEAVQLLHLTAAGHIDHQNPCLELGGIEGIVGYCPDVRGLPAHESLKVIVKSMQGLSLPCESWGAFAVFWRFVAHQARAFLSSNFLLAGLADDLPGFRLFMVQRILDLCCDFSTNLAAPSHSASTGFGSDALAALNAGKPWAQQRLAHVIAHRGFISFFNLQVAQAGAAPLSPQLVTLDVQLHAALAANHADLSPDYASRSRLQLLQDLRGVLGLHTADPPEDPDPHYHLSVDSIKKMMATWLRLQAGIPVIIQGETGCGKTSLMEFLAKVVGVQARVCRVHGGTSRDDVRRAVRQAEALSRKRRHDKPQGCLLFLDEINCGPDMGCFKELLCDRRLDGRGIAQGVLLVAACNPYRKLPEAVIRQQQAMGLGFRSHDSEQLRGIPLRDLVYRVHALPASLIEFVWDFGQLAPEPERAYVEATLHTQTAMDPRSETATCFTEAIFAAQRFMRERGELGGLVGAVSVRDYKERAVPVFCFFLSLFSNEKVNEDIAAMVSRAEREHRESDSWSPEVKAIVIALYVAYEARVSDKDLRAEFRQAAAEHLRPLSHCASSEELSAEMKRWVEHLQGLMTEEMQLSQGVVMNEVLRENIFMMAVCAQLSIPLFVVGKPGTSKSLAKTVIADTMKGARSPARLFRHLKHLTLFSYQCSPHSTSEDVQRVFARAEQFLEGKDRSAFASVVVLDEVGLAEDSPRMPLKVLHPLLESPAVAFFGLSNWAIDPAKMNRCVALSRFDPDCDDLIRTAQGISMQQPKLAPLLLPACTAYLHVHAHCQPRPDFYGLRDFFSLMRMLGSMPSLADPASVSVSTAELESCVRTCFGGSEQTEQILKCFMSHMASSLSIADDTTPRTPLDIITARLEVARPTGRFLLIQTENTDAALQTMVDKGLLDARQLEVLSGSKFPLDQSLDDMCAQLRTVRMCMAADRTLVCCELEHCLEALYDLLNQFYTQCLGKLWVDVGLGNERMQCEVGDGFRILILASAAQVASFPIPLLNRLEKHVLRAEDFLSSPEQRAFKLLSQDLNLVATPPFHSCSSGRSPVVPLDRLLPGYCDDTLPSLVASAGDQVHAADDDGEQRKADMLRRALWACPPDAIVAGSESGDIASLYFKEQEHGSLARYLALLGQIQPDRGVRSIVTTYGATSVAQVVGEVEAYIAARGADLAPLSVYVHALDDVQRMSELETMLTEMQKWRPDDSSDYRYVVLLTSVVRQRPSLVHQILNVIKARLNLASCSQNLHVIVVLQQHRDKAKNAGLSLLFEREWHRAHLDTCSGSNLVCSAWDRGSLYKLMQPEEAGGSAVVDICELIDRMIPTALGRLSSADPDFQPLACVRAVKRLFIQSDETRRAVKERMLKLLTERSNQGGQQGETWIASTARDAQFLRLSGSFERALHSKVEGAVLMQLTSMLQAVACDGGLDMLQDMCSHATPQAASKQRIWTEIMRAAGDTETVLFIPSVGCEVSDADASAPVANHGKGGRAFCAKFPLSFAVHRVIEEKRSSCVVPLVNTVSVSTLFQRLDEICSKDVLQDYLHDLSRMSYCASTSETEEDEHRVVTALLSAELSECETMSDGATALMVQAHLCISTLTPTLFRIRKVFAALPCAVSTLRQWMDARHSAPSVADTVRHLLQVVLAETALGSELSAERTVTEWARTVKQLTEVMQEAVGTAPWSKDDVEKQRCHDEWLQREMGMVFVDTAFVDGQRPTFEDFWSGVITGSDFDDKAALNKVLRFWKRWKGSERMEEVFLRLLQLLRGSHPRQAAVVDVLVSDILTVKNRFVAPYYMAQVAKGAADQSGLVVLSTPGTIRLLRPVIASCLLECGARRDAATKTISELLEAGRGGQGREAAGPVRALVVASEELLSALSDEDLLAAHQHLSNTGREANEPLMAATLRVMLQRTAQRASGERTPLPQTELSNAALAACCDPDDDDDERSHTRLAQSYFLQQVVNNLGPQGVRKLKADARCPWVRDLVSQPPRAGRLDAFVIHGNEYQRILSAIGNGKQMHKPFAEAALALLQTVTAETVSSTGRGQGSKKRKRAADVDGVMEALCRGDAETKRVLESIARNQLGGTELGAHRAVLTASRQQTDVEALLHSLVVHAVVMALGSTEHTHTLRMLLDNPSGVLECRLPGADDDQRRLEEGSTDLGDDNGEWLSCENGHPLPPGAARDCVCGAGPCYIIACDDIAVIDVDAPVLPELRRQLSEAPCAENPNDIENETSAVRSLTATALVVVQAVTHALLLAGAALSCEQSATALVKSIGVPVSGRQSNKTALLSALSQALVRDVAALSRLLRRSTEDSILILHAVCHRKIQLQAQEAAAEAGDWSTPEKRDRWEKAFNRSVIGPVLSDSDRILDSARQDIGLWRGCTKLTEVLRRRDGDLLWGDRRMLSVEHCHRHLEATNTSLQQFQCLRKVLESRSRLQVLSCLLPLVRLQAALVDKFSGRISLADARKTTIKTALATLQDDAGTAAGLHAFTSACTQLRYRLDTLLPHTLTTAVRLWLPEGIATVTDELPLSYLLPSCVCEGVIGVALVVAMCEIQNRFLRAVEEPACRLFHVRLDSQEVSVVGVAERELVTAEDGALSNMLHASCGPTREDEAEIDFESLERSVVAALVDGRRRLSIRPVHSCSFSDQLSMARVLSALRSRGLDNKLDDREWSAILDFLAASDAVPQALSTLETVLRCLSVTSVLPSEVLGGVVRDVLMLRDDALADDACPAFALHPSVALALWQRLDLHVALQRLEPEGTASDAEVLHHKQEPLSAEMKCTLTAALGRIDVLGLLGEMRELVLVRAGSDSTRGALRPALLAQAKKKGTTVSGLDHSFPPEIQNCHLCHAWIVVALSHIEASPSCDALPVLPRLRSSHKGKERAVVAVDVAASSFSYPEVSCAAGENLAGVAPSWAGGRMDPQLRGKCTFSVRPQLPPGLKCDPATGVVRGQPHRTVPRGIYIVSCRGLGGLWRSELILTVSNPPPVPFYYKSTSQVELMVGVELQGPLTPKSKSQRAMPEAARYFAEGLPAGLYLCPRSGGISGKLQGECDSAVTVTARVGASTAAASLRILSRVPAPAQFRYSTTVCVKRRPFESCPMPMDASPLSGAGIRFEAAQPLPPGIVLDAQTGVVKGVWTGAGGIAAPSTVSVSIKAVNETGSQTCKLALEMRSCDDVLASLRGAVKRLLDESASGQVDFELPLRCDTLRGSTTVDLSHKTVTSWREDKASLPGGALYERFVAALEAAPDKTIRLVFHGSLPGNIDPILKNGLDPARRTGQSHGVGEYFGGNAATSALYCHGGNRMLVCAIMMDASGLSYKCPLEAFFVVHKTAHQLPLLAFTFSG